MRNLLQNLQNKATNGHQVINKFFPESLENFNQDELDNEEKIKLIEKKFKEIMLILGLDLTDDSLKDTPGRVARMYVNEVFSGLNPVNEPKVTLFENKFNYDGMIIEKNIPVYSFCEHHFLPIIGKAHIGYISRGKIIGLSKLNRIVHYFSKRPQVQERLTVQIAEYLKTSLGTDSVAVRITAEHMCVAARGLEDIGSSTVTSSFYGQFLNDDKRNEFNAMVNSMLR